jgi:glycosyltransferase involved in cell wall biosynthesis
MLFVGRLSKEKGIDVLARAAQSISGGAVRVAGSGPLSGLLDGAKGITPLGNLSATQVRLEMEGALSLVVPSIWYENFPRTIVEAFAAGLPVIASRIGALADIVTEGQTGLLFNAGDSEDLASKMAWAQAHPAEMAAMGVRARAQYEREFSAEVNHRMLLNIYQEAIHVGS